MKQRRSQTLGQAIRARREALGLSGRELAERIGAPNSTIVRIESGEITAPTPDTLARLAAALRIDLADLYALADYPMPKALPTFRPYLRSKYRDLPPAAVDDLTRAFKRVIEKHGYDPDGPASGQDEAA